MGDAILDLTAVAAMAELRDAKGYRYEEESPWEPLSAENGLAPEVALVSATRPRTSECVEL